MDWFYIDNRVLNENNRLAHFLRVGRDRPTTRSLVPNFEARNRAETTTQSGRG